MLIRGIGGDREVGASYLSRQESGGDFRHGPEREGKFQERTGVALVGERRQGIKTDKHKDKKTSWCQNKPLCLLLCIAFIASKPKINVCKISKWVYV